jgi:CRP/FNR family transcriptional regulator
MPADFVRTVPRECAKCQFRTLRSFCNLTESALQEFDRIGTRVEVPKGAVLFREAEEADSALVLCTGQVKLSCSSKDGRTLILKISMPGDVLGLGAVISGSVFEVTAETIMPTVIKKVRREDLLSFLERHGEASMHAAKSLSDEYKSAFFGARRLALSTSAAGRLATVLLEWAEAAACGNQQGRFIMALTHEDLGNLAGMSRETVTRTLSRFQKEKLLSVRGASFQILAPRRLAELAA